RRTRLWRAFSMVSVLSLASFVVGPADAQIGDAPPLGFEIDPIEGMVGDTVVGQVDVDDIAEHCITDPYDFVAQFVDPESPASGGTAYWDAVEAYVQSIDDLEEIEPARLQAIYVAAFFPLGLALDLVDPESEGLAESAMQGTFIMAFADLATQSPIAPYGSFDKNTGE